MTNKQIAYAFDELANLMELHEEDHFESAPTAMPISASANLIFHWPK